MSQLVVKITFTVLLINGEEIPHTYDVPSDFNEADKLVKSELEKITIALTNRGKTFLGLSNPDIFYNPDNVLGVKITSIPSEELEKIIKNAHKEAIGFKKD